MGKGEQNEFPEPPQDEISHSKEVRSLEDDEVDRSGVEVW